MAAPEERHPLAPCRRRRLTILVTGDHKLRYQQNLPKIGIGVVVVTRVRNRIEDLRPLIPRIAAAVETTRPGDVTEIAP